MSSSVESVFLNLTQRYESSSHWECTYSSVWVLILFPIDLCSQEPLEKRFHGVTPNALQVMKVHYVYIREPNWYTGMILACQSSHVKATLVFCQRSMLSLLCVDSLAWWWTPLFGCPVKSCWSCLTSRRKEESTGGAMVSGQGDDMTEAPDVDRQGWV